MEKILGITHKNGGQLMNFNVNSLFLYIVAICVIVFVLAQSGFFLVRSYRRGKELGISTAKLRKTIISTAVFTIAPAVSILIGIVTLSKFLGIPLPWIRMSVIGAITYELPAATSTANAWEFRYRKPLPTLKRIRQSLGL